MKKTEEVLRNKVKKANDDTLMNSGLTKLANTLNFKVPRDMATEEVLIDNLLFKACAAVGKAKKIIILPSPGLRKGNAASKDLLGDIARASQMRTRKIILKENWWQEDNGALLAYREADGQPVALLPVSPVKYKLYDPADDSQVMVDQVVAETLQAQADTFYRPLPPKVVGYKDLLRYLADGIWKSDAVTVLAMGLLGGLLGALTPVVTGIIFDSVIPDGEKVLLSQIGFLLIAIALTTFAFNLTRSFALHRIEGRTEADLQAAVWDRLLSLPVPFFKEYTAGELAGRAMGISAIRSILSGAAVNSLVSGIFAVFYFILLFYYSGKLALIATAIVALIMAVSLLFGWLQIRYERQLIDLNNTLSGKVFGLLTGISKIKTSGAEKRAFHQWAGDFSQVRKVTYRKETLGNKMAVFNAMMNIIATGFIFFALIKLNGINLGAGKFIAFHAAFSSYLGAMLEVSGVILQLNIIKPLYERTKPILETLPEFDQEKTDPGELAGNIEISHVNFRYHPAGPLILDDVVLEIKQGDYVGIVGSSGSGKSTLFRLLLGFEKAESGQIFYDQHDLGNVDIRSIRRQLGVVLQSGQLMYGSIFDNIVAANPGLTIDNAWQAARMAGMEEDIKSMPMGMHTMVSEDGGTLSGGQRQRLLITRAIISRPKIIYFDEATSALDNKTQKIVSESLAGLGATRVVIAHRLSTIANCNKIFVMDKGRIVEQGSYQELFDQGGLFTQLVKRQLA
ncbi:NHLP bacteriocin export ABC transporter permease/ATPase subunit [Desulforamulus aeronauticus]|uniref:ATP-binding cassette, subfamily C n=1 Tax=Desulforamulus aeronauticus DSM 10349 TaxID=1121421 RepID=A0A1M6NV13_9FIRM|nr:NHLP bacteriocin export ABC transporter permease/ATPase subunit [Desulforamulus aeronauticus]SHJ99515.1 ATP-binding cassette, subfamily C [Desulforamulus aeronauticus DSM 10349]